MKTLSTVEAHIFDKQFPWGEINRELALKNTFVLDCIREACLIEAFFAIYTGKMQELFWYDVDATSIFTIEAFEAYTHYYSLRRYLETVGYEPVTDEEIVALRAEDKDKRYDDAIRELVNFAMTEHFAAQFFADLAEQTEEPVLRNMLTRFASQEVTHSEFAFDLLEKRLVSDPDMREQILERARDYRHIGAYVLPRVSNAREDNLSTIQAFNRRIEKLVGLRLSDYLASE